MRNKIGRCRCQCLHFGKQRKFKNGVLYRQWEEEQDCQVSLGFRFGETPRFSEDTNLGRGVYTHVRK